MSRLELVSVMRSAKKHRRSAGKILRFAQDDKGNKIQGDKGNKIGTSLSLARILYCSFEKIEELEKNL